MYAGHAGLALYVKAKRPRIPLALLIVAAFGPDWIEWFVGAKGQDTTAAFASHSIPAVVIGAVVVAGAYAVVRGDAEGRREALAIALLYLAHWGVDFITGIKPTWPGGPMVGLKLYDHAAADFVLEAIVVLACARVYVRSLGGRARGLAAALPAAGLLALQLAFNLSMHVFG